MTTVRTIAAVTALTWIGFGGWLLLDPAALLRAFDVADAPPMFLAELRAFYGGVEIGIGVVIALLIRRQPDAAALVGATTLLGAATGRIIGMLVDAASLLLAAFAGLELLGAGLNLWAWRCARRGDNALVPSETEQMP